MCTLRNFTRSCGESIPPGTRTKLYLIPTAEITAFPDTEAVANSGTAAGDTKITGEDFTLSTEVGEGFWREVDIWVDTGNIRNELEGEIGGQGYRQRVDFFILGNGKTENEFADTLLCQSGCLIAIIPDKAGNYHIIGNLDDPVFLEAATGGSGEATGRSGMQYTLYANTGKTTLIHDVATYPLDLTPVPAP